MELAPPTKIFVRFEMLMVPLCAVRIANFYSRLTEKSSRGLAALASTAKLRHRMSGAGATSLRIHQTRQDPAKHRQPLVVNNEGHRLLRIGHVPYALLRFDHVPVLLE